MATTTTFYIFPRKCGAFLINIIILFEIWFNFESKLIKNQKNNCNLFLIICPIYLFKLKIIIPIIILFSDKIGLLNHISKFTSETRVTFLILNQISLKNIIPNYFKLSNV